MSRSPHSPAQSLHRSPETPVPAQPISSPQDLAPLLEVIAAASEVFLDTEADSLHHYFEKTCLLQFTLEGGAEGARHFLVDPLAGLDLAPLFGALRDKPLVLHGADYDLRLMKADFNFVPCSIFDTMLAARLAGHSAFGLEALVQRYVGCALDHGAQKADWSQRPLPPRLLHYAVDDTRHLPLIVSKLRAELAALGRSEWHRQQCQQLVELCTAAPQGPAEDPWRIKGSFHLDSQSLAILRELWQWRDGEARGWDRPSFMVCNNDKLHALVTWARAHPHGDLNHGPELPRRWPPRRYKSLCVALTRAWDMTAAEWPSPPPRPARVRHDHLFPDRFEAIRQVRDAVAREIGLEPSLLAPKSQIEAVARQNPKSPEELATVERWLPWQTELFGRKFMGALAPLRK